MMTRAKVKRTVFEAVLLSILSLVVLFAGTIISAGKEDERLQFIYDGRFTDVLPADRYSEVESGIPENFPEVDHIYTAYDSNGTVLGYIIDLTVEGDGNGKLHLLTGVTYDGAQLTGIKHVKDETDPVSITDEEIEAIASQTIGKQIPVAPLKAKDPSEEVAVTTSRISGLHDGVFYAQAMKKDSNGYIDYVEIEVSGGIITRVQWDAFNVDRTTKNRRESALSGAFSVSGENWATQSYNLCHALIDVQDPSRLAMKSDGRTEIVEGVTTDIRPFVVLVGECIDNSRAGFDKDSYIEELSDILTKLFEKSPEELGLLNKDGMIVYSFHEYPNLFKLYDGNGAEVKEMTVREMALGPDQASDDPYSVTYEEGGSESGYVGAEDGYIPGSGNKSYLTDSIDGIPMSEIRTYIEGISSKDDRSLVVVTGINTAYRFLKEYLNWMA